MVWGRWAKNSERYSEKVRTFFNVETGKTWEKCDSLFLLIYEIVVKEREHNLEMDAEDFIELLNFPLKKTKHRRVYRTEEAKFC